jgi:predicted NBD/HSP70 family sugar kinase
VKGLKEIFGDKEFKALAKEQMSLISQISEKIGYKVTIDNDTRAMTYGEMVKGLVKGEKNIIFINLSWGLGAGLVINGDIFTGKSGFSGEFGHFNVFDNEILCHCGKRGCLETEVSGAALHRNLVQCVQDGKQSILSKRILHGDTSLTLDEIISATNKEDLLCIELVEEIGQKLGRYLAGLINLLNPELVIIGGVLAQTGDYILQPIKSAVRKYSLNLVNKDSVIALSKLLDKAGVIGACMLSRRSMFES